MTRKEFKKLMTAWKKMIDYEEKVMKTKIVHEDILDKHNLFTDIILGSLFTEHGLDWLYWFAYETDFQRKKGYDAYDNAGTKEERLICQDVNGLYDYLEKNKYFKV